MIPFVKAECGRRQERRRLLHITPAEAAWAHRAGRHLFEGIRSLPVESRVASPTWAVRLAALPLPARREKTAEA